MTRNLLNRGCLALVFALLVLAGCGRKKEESPKLHLTPMPKRPSQTATQAAPSASPSQGVTQAAPGAQSKAAATQKPVPAAGPGVPLPGQPQPGANAIQKPISSPVKGAAGVASFNFHGRTDPFRPSIAAPEPVPQAKQERVVKREGDLLPIQSFDVSKFKVVGIIAGLKENKALVVDPAGKGYVVQAGMVLGSNQGRISRITPNGVEILEVFNEGKGHVKKRKIVLTLAKKR